MAVGPFFLKQVDDQEKINRLQSEVERLRQQVNSLRDENRHLRQRSVAHIGLPYSLAFIKYLANHLPQCIVQAFDHNMRFFFTGGEGLELINASPSHFIGKTIREVDIADQETPGFFEPIYKAVLNGQYKEYTFHTRRDHIYQGVVLPLIDSEGQVAAGLVICRESVTQDEAEQELMESAVAQERQRIAQELHDVVSQTLFTVNMIADVLPQLWERSPETAQKKLKLMRHNTQLAFTQMRTLLYELRPQSLEEVDLPDLIEQLVTTMKSRTDMAIELTISCEGDWKELPYSVKIALYRIVQEGMNNAIQHARARRFVIDIQAMRATNRLVVKLCDDGQGFDPNDAFPGHLGLKIMRDRAAQAGLQISIESELGRGTEINAIWLCKKRLDKRSYASDPHPSLR